MNYFLVVVLVLLHLIYLIGMTGKLFSCRCDSNAMSIIMHFHLPVMGIYRMIIVKSNLLL